MNAILETVIQIDSNGIILFANNSTKGLLGYDPEEIVGKNIKMFVPESEKNKHDGHIQEYLKMGKSNIVGVGSEVSIIAKSGPIIVHLNVGVYDGASGKGFIATLHDRSEVLKERELIIKKNKKLESVLSERKQLVHVLCHDLKNPIASAFSFIDLYKLEVKDLPLKLKKVKKCLENSLDIVDYVRDYMALHEGKLNLELKSTCVNDLIEKSIQIFEMKLKHKNIIINFNSPDDDIYALLEEKSFLNSVLNNLISNAIKFSNEGDTIDISLNNIETIVNIKIRDYGVGMPAEILDNLFNVSKSTSRSGTSGEKGTGFGLPLVERFVASCEGSLKIDSWEKKDHPENFGTEIAITLWGSKPPK